MQKYNTPDVNKCKNIPTHRSIDLFEKKTKNPKNLQICKIPCYRHIKITKKNNNTKCEIIIIMAVNLLVLGSASLILGQTADPYLLDPLLAHGLRLIVQAVLYCPKD